mmetsp:Transcript_55773/g.99319  ORF Transcript_55773/g.99319 Transcript_55773/m.99319 type:complete len:457 (+) Transcript_55773:31-1401(+)
MAFARQLCCACLCLAAAAVAEEVSIESAVPHRQTLARHHQQLPGNFQAKRNHVTLKNLGKSAVPPKQTTAHITAPKFMRFLHSAQRQKQSQQNTWKQLQEKKLKQKEKEEALERKRKADHAMMMKQVKQQQEMLENEKKQHEMQMEKESRSERQWVAAHRAKVEAMREKHQKQTQSPRLSQHMQPVKLTEHLKHKQPPEHQHRQSFRSGARKLTGRTALLQTAKDRTVTAALDSAYSEATSLLSTPTDASNMAAANKTQEEHRGKQMPVQAHLSMDSVRSMLKDLSPECAEQFGRMMQGKGRAKQLHLFGTGSFEASEETCSELGGAICDNHAKIRQTQVAGGRTLVVDSKVDGNSCLPRKCIQEADLEHLATFVQRIAVKSIGPASQGQEAAEVVLDVDCSGSGGGSYAGQSRWSAKEAGAVDPKPLPHEVHSDSKRLGPAMLLSALIGFIAFQW